MFRRAVHTVLNPRTIRRWSVTRNLTCDADLPDELIKTLWDGDVDRLVFSATPLQVKDRCIVVRLAHAQGPFLVKRHTWGGLSRTVRSAWRASAARGCMQWGRQLAGIGVPTPRPRACVEQRFGPFGYRSYLMTDFVEGTSLYRFIRDRNPPRDVLADLARQVSGIWANLVAHGISHNDMKPENFIVDPSGRVWLIDLERVRIHHNLRRMQRRQISDIEVFLHRRAWRNHGRTRDVFRQAFLEAAQGTSLVGMITAAGMDLAERQNWSEAADDERLSVLILRNETGVDPARLQRAIDSTRGFADEIVVVNTSLTGDRSESIFLGEHHPATSGTAHAKWVRVRPPTISCPPQHPWVLVLEANEAVTPILAINIEKRIAARPAYDAMRIPIEPYLGGQCIGKPRHGAAAPIRLFNQRRCSFSVAGGVLAISADPEKTGKLDGTIQQEVCSSVAELVEQVNRESTRAAQQRLHQGGRACLGRAMRRSCRDFVKQYFVGGRFQFGWAGFQASLLESLSIWLQEYKLWQMGHEFPPHELAIADKSDDDEPSLAGRASRLLPPEPVPSVKAA
jgi:tRNA A-37 threonylcarbamoyl transferase component Bud32